MITFSCLVLLVVGFLLGVDRAKHFGIKGVWWRHGLVGSMVAAASIIALAAAGFLIVGGGWVFCNVLHLP